MLISFCRRAPREARSPVRQPSRGPSPQSTSYRNFLSEGLVYSWDDELRPMFRMNLPEGYLPQVLQEEFGTIVGARSADSRTARECDQEEQPGVRARCRPPAGSEECARLQTIFGQSPLDRRALLRLRPPSTRPRAQIVPRANPRLPCTRAMLRMTIRIQAFIPDTASRLETREPHKEVFRDLM